MISVLLSLVLSLAWSSAVSSSVPHTRLLSRQAQVARNFVEQNGCNVNVCFAIDGSDVIAPEEFQKQKEFLLDLVSALSLDDSAAYTAVQYGVTNYPITPLSTDEARFNRDVFGTTSVKDRESFIGTGIVYCHRQVARHRTDANKIVVVGDGRSNFGGDPVRRADVFRRFGGSVCAVGVGFQDEESLEKIAGGKKNVIGVDEYIELSLVVEDCVKAICSRA